MLVETEEHSKSRGDGKGGRVVLTTINRTVKAYLLAVLGAEYIARIIPRGTHQWKKFLQPQEIARMGADAGLRVEDVTGLIYNPITNTWRLDKNDIDVNFAMCLKGERGQGQRGKA
ncbi:3-demethylubiquinone-9 3-methyltransferase [Nannochloropsis gaditana]|uniref:3-demethylubiquinone-9 3-methyltransferase n=1 Tax=Nannochloropsis gaditana TaxID=72520 RepID=W7U1M3_9STRA|nr:3-demethylubiquinone-9 3-methyltransferase [Nannochloropsis gaditana]